jgi:L-fuconolactonase
MMTIDAHQHFWDPATAHYPWMTHELGSIRRAFAPHDLEVELGPAGVARTILVQTRSSEEETRGFLKIAAATDFVAGVVGWVDLTASDVGDRLDQLLASKEGKWLVGVRHQAHDEADAEWLLRNDVACGLAEVERRGLAYDLLVRPRELAAALQTVAAFPGLRFVVDHIAKPDIAGGGFGIWSERLAPFTAHRGHVWCKLSGMVTEADWHAWSIEQLRPYLNEAIAIFGASRCMLGSDWPVCLLAATYRQVVDLVRDSIADLPQADQAAILAGSAMTAYRLDGARMKERPCRAM